MREREDRTLPFAFRSEEMSLPTIREHVAPNSTIGRDLMARIFRGLDTGRVSQLWGDFVVKVVGCLARVVVELFERAVDAAQSERRLPTVVSAIPGAACSPSGPPLVIGLLVVGISRLTVLARGARTAPN
jgi:hypothetical protein